MKAPSLAVAVLLGLVSYSEPAQALHAHNHLHRVPRSQQLVDHNGDEFVEADALDQDIETQLQEEEEETPRQEQESLIRRMRQQTKRANLAQHHSTAEEDEEEDQEERLGKKTQEMEEDDEFVQQSEMMNEEDRDEESGDERDYLSEAEEDNEDEYLEQEEDDETNVQVSESDDDDDDDAPQNAVQIEKVPQRSYFFAGDTNMMANGKEYQRQYPEEFNEDSPNKFMHHILVEYALEKKDDKGQPSGQFSMNKKWTQAASREVLMKHKKMDEAAADKYMNQYFGRTWEHFDVNDDQMLDALDMPAFMKYLCSDQSLDLDKL